MLQSLLAGRSHLVIHRESRETRVYALVPDKKGPKLRENAPGAKGILRMNGGGKITGSGATMTQLVNWFSNANGWIGRSWTRPGSRAATTSRWNGLPCGRAPVRICLLPTSSPPSPSSSVSGSCRTTHPLKFLSSIRWKCPAKTEVAARFSARAGGALLPGLRQAPVAHLLHGDAAFHRTVVLSAVVGLGSILFT